MNKKEVKQTILLSFIVAFIVELIDWLKELYFRSSPFGIFNWFWFLVFLGGFFMLILSKGKNLFNFDKEVREILEKYGYWALLIGVVGMIASFLLTPSP